MKIYADYVDKFMYFKAVMIWNFIRYSDVIRIPDIA